MALLQQNSGTHAQGTATFSATLPSATSASSRIVIAVFANAVITAPTGFTSRNPQVNIAGHYVFDGPGGASSWQMTASPAGHMTWHVFEIANGAFDVSAGINAGAGASVGTYSSPAITPTAGSRDIIVSLGAVDNAAQPTWSNWTNSFIEQFDTASSQTNEFNGHATALLSVTANGSTAYSTTANHSQGNFARSAIIAAYSSTGGGVSAPTVSAGADANHPVNTVFSRTATENANGGTITSRSWTIVSGPAGAGSTIGTAAALSWTPATAGTYVLRYSATNSAGTGTDDATITVASGQITTTYRMFAAASPPTTGEADVEDYWLGVEFYVTEAATLTQIHYWGPTTNTNSNARRGALMQVTSATAGTTVVPSALFPTNVAGWNTLTLGTPYTLTPNQRYRAVVLMPIPGGNTGYSTTALYWSTGPGASGLTNGPLVMPNTTNATGQDQCSYTISMNGTTPVFPESSFNSPNYWIDVTISVTSAANAQRMAPDSILASSNLTGAVTVIQDDPDSPDGNWLVAP